MTLFRNLGPFHTTAIGHGEMPLTIENNRGHDVGIETLHASLDAGCRHIDTAWAYYTPGEEEQTGEKLVREALDTWKGPREEVTVATKVGLRRAWDGDKPIWPRDGKPEHLIEYGKQSAQALGVDSIDLLYLHRHDPEVPYNESCEGIKALLDQGVAQWAGVSNVSIEQLKTRTGDSRRQARCRAEPVFADPSGNPRTRWNTARRKVSPSCAGVRSAATATRTTSICSTRSAKWPPSMA